MLLLSPPLLFCSAIAQLTLLKTNAVLARVESDQLHLLVKEAKEPDLLDLLKALQHACAAGTDLGNTLCLSLAKVMLCWNAHAR